MTSFNEGNINRAADGKFAAKTTGEADLDLDFNDVGYSVDEYSADLARNPKPVVEPEPEPVKKTYDDVAKDFYDQGMPGLSMSDKVFARNFNDDRKVVMMDHLNRGHPAIMAVNEAYLMSDESAKKIADQRRQGNGAGIFPEATEDRSVASMTKALFFKDRKRRKA